MAKLTDEMDIIKAHGFTTIEPWGEDGNDGMMHIIEFDSISDMAEFDFCRRDKSPAASRNSWAYGRNEGFRTYEENQLAIREGRSPQKIIDLYEATRDAIESQIVEMIATMPSARRKRKYDIEGSEISIERIMVHNPEAWERRVRGQRKQTVRIAINYGYSAGTSDRSFVDGAVRGVALADVLQRLGHNVEITATSFSIKGGKRYAINALLKASDKPVDPQQLLVTALPALSRVFEFGVLDVFGEYTVQHMSVDRVTQLHVDRFGIDVFASGSDFKFMGPDSEGHIAQTVAKINAMLLAPVDPTEAQAINDLLAQFDVSGTPSEPEPTPGPGPGTPSTPAPGTPSTPAPGTPSTPAPGTPSPLMGLPNTLESELTIFGLDEVLDMLVRGTIDEDEIIH